MKRQIINISLCLFVPVYLVMMDTEITHAQTEIMSGDVSGTLTLSKSPYHINGAITIPNGETLIIEPGVDIIFTGHFKFNVQGRLLAIGTKEDRITFTSQDTSMGWHGIRFSKTFSTNDSSKIIFCNLRYGKTVGSSNDDKRGGSIFVKSFSKVLISHCIITNNRTVGGKLTGGAGIFLDSSSVKIMNNSISSNNAMGGHGGGIFVINTILCGNTAGIGKQVHVGSPAEPNFYFCDIEGSKNAFARDHKPGGNFDGGYEKNIDSKPLFMDAVNGDYHLSDFSLCIGAGVVTIEINGIWYTAPLYDCEGNLKPAPADSNPDVGAFENIRGLNKIFSNKKN